MLFIAGTTIEWSCGGTVIVSTTLLAAEDTTTRLAALAWPVLVLHACFSDVATTCCLTALAKSSSGRGCGGRHLHGEQDVGVTFIFKLRQNPSKEQKCCQAFNMYTKLENMSASHHDVVTAYNHLC
jgi:hypothetical protein